MEGRRTVMEWKNITISHVWSTSVRSLSHSSVDENSELGLTGGSVQYAMYNRLRDNLPMTRVVLDPAFSGASV